MDKQQQDFYEKIRKQVREWCASEDGRSNEYVEYLLVAPDLFHLLCKLVVDKDVPAGHKAKLVMVMAYFVSPIDLIPEGLVGPVGFADDIALTAYALNKLLNDVNEEVVLRNWAGDADLLSFIQEILRIADKMIGTGLWSKVKNMF